MQSAPSYRYDTPAGPFWITLGLDRLWHLIWDGEDLGGYPLPEVVARNAAAGLAASPTCGRSHLCGLSPDLDEWVTYPAPTELRTAAAKKW